MYVRDGDVIRERAQADDVGEEAWNVDVVTLGLKSMAVRAPNWLFCCTAKMLLIWLWMALIGIDGSKMTTLGPKLGLLEPPVVTESAALCEPAPGVHGDDREGVGGGGRAGDERGRWGGHLHAVGTLGSW